MSPIRMSKIESAVRIAIEFNEAVNRHDVASMIQLLSDDCVFESFDPAPNGTFYAGKDNVAQYWHDFVHASPQARIEIEDIFGLGERCIMRWTYNWEDETGKEGHVRGVDIFRVRDGAIREMLSYVKG